MHILKIETPGLQKANIAPGDDWEITHHRLFNLSPDDAGTVEVRGGKVSIWNLCFIEDLLQAVNQSKRLLLDVGWYPDSDPSGNFRLQLVSGKISPTGRSPYDWDNPKIDFRTRSMNELLAKIHEIIS